MSIRDSLLAILDQGPCYGYQLGYEFEMRTGGSVPLNTGQIYSTLERLDAAGLIQSSGADDEGRALYTITPAGREDVQSWLSTPVPHDMRRNELATKLALAVSLPGIDIAHVIQTQRHAAMNTLQELTRLKRNSSSSVDGLDLGWSLLLDAHLFEVEAEVRWLDHCETRIARAIAENVDLSVPLNPDPPKRGRPTRAPASSASHTNATPKGADNVR